MKKLLPFVAALAVGAVLPAQADTVEKFTGTMLSRISPSGEWAVSCGDGNFYVINLKTEDVYEYDSSEDGSDAFPEAGYGSSVSDNGIVVGSNTYNGSAAYWKLTDDAPETGEWFQLPVLSQSGSTAHSITADGSRIVGYSYRSGASFGGDGIGTVPVLWNQNEDGEYELVELPYPTVDVFGRAPQYIIALGISKDGHRIIGQVTDFAGFIHSPIVYDEQADGSWTYAYVHPELQNLGLDYPEWPGDYEGPSYPSILSYMTQEEQDAYDAALADWAANGYTGSYPRYADYISEEGYAEYQAAYEDYQEQYSAWSDKAYAFEDVYYEAMYSGLGDLLMNQTALSTNGRYYAATKAGGDYFSGYTYTPVNFDLNSGDYKVYDESAASATYVNNNGAMLGVTVGVDSYTRLAWAKASNSDEWVRLPEFIRQYDADAATWMEENLSFTYIAGVDWGTSDDDDDWGLLSKRRVANKLDWDDDDDDEEYDPYIYATDVFDGLPVANEDMTKIVSWVFNMYAENYEDYEYSLVITLPEGAGVKNVTVAGKQLSVKASRNGIITINGDAASLEVYSIAGNKVLSVKSPASTVKTDLNAGLYLVKVTDANGKSAVTKAVIAK